MADNIQAKANVGAGIEIIAADEVGGVFYPRSKMTLGDDGKSDGDVSAKNPMPVALAMRKVFDRPKWEYCNPLIQPTAAGCATTESESTIFHLHANTGYLSIIDASRESTLYSTSVPNFVTPSASALAYISKRGFHARVLAGTASTTLIMGCPPGKLLNGKKVSIVNGAGRGQERTLTWVSDTTHDNGAASATDVAYIEDTSKKWRVNEHTGRMVGITSGGGTVQYRRILYNSSTRLYVYDAELLPQEHWGNQPFWFNPVDEYPITATQYKITSTTFSVDTWDVTPNGYSFATTNTGGLLLMMSSPYDPYFSLWYYDVVHNQWQQKFAPQGLFNNYTIPYDIALKATTGPAAITPFYTSSGTITGGARTVADAAAAWAIDEHRNSRVEIIAGAGAGESQRIVSNTATELTVTNQWLNTLDGTSQFRIVPNYDYCYATTDGTSALLGYSLQSDHMATGRIFDYGVVGAMAAFMLGDVSFGITSGVRIALGVQGINVTPTAGGTNYKIGDVLTCAVGGSGAQVRVKEITTGGVVTVIELQHTGTGTGYAVGAGKATTGGSGTGCTIEVTTIGPTALVTTSTAHTLRKGFFPELRGASESAWNVYHQILSVPAFNQFCVATTATANMAAATAQSTTVIVDSAKSWIVNEHIGRVVRVTATDGTSQYRWITANTANTLTVAAITASTNGKTRYVIFDANPMGSESQFLTTAQEAYGHATGGTSTTLVDTTKNWVPDCWKDNVVKIEAGTGYGTGRITITGNTKDTLTYAVQGFSPDPTTRYEIPDSWGLATTGAAYSATPITEATRKKWAVDRWAGRHLRIVGGNGVGSDGSIASNTATAISTDYTNWPNLDNTSVYAIMGLPVRASGHALISPWGATSVVDRRKLLAPRGSNHGTIDALDLSTDHWYVGQPLSPSFIGTGQGSSFAYCGGDEFYFSQKVTTGRTVDLYKMDVRNNAITSVGTNTVAQRTGHNGNLMAAIKTPDAYAIPYVYVIQTSGKNMQRVAVY